LSSEYKASAEAAPAAHYLEYIPQSPGQVPTKSTTVHLKCPQKLGV